MTNLILLSITLSTNTGYKEINREWTPTNYNTLVYVERYKVITTNYTFGIIDGTNRVPLLNITKP